MHLPWKLLFGKELQCLTQQLTETMEKDRYANVVSRLVDRWFSYGQRIILGIAIYLFGS